MYTLDIHMTRMYVYRRPHRQSDQLVISTGRSTLHPARSQSHHNYMMTCAHALVIHCIALPRCSEQLITSQLIHIHLMIMAACHLPMQLSAQLRPVAGACLGEYRQVTRCMVRLFHRRIFGEPDGWTGSMNKSILICCFQFIQ